MEDCLAYLFGLDQIGIKFGLENITAMVESLGHPERAFRTVHIAGTNGKGSVTAMVDTGLRAAGLRSARYTSPHLVDVRERFVIDGRPVLLSALSAATREVRARIAAFRSSGALQVQPTFFEVTTAIAFELFRTAGVEIAVIEVGLGGRLDATNVVMPEVSAITSIALDHEQFLGRTLGEIAGEKAGIIKPGVPVVVGRMEEAAHGVIVRIARGRGAEIVEAWDGVKVDGHGRIRLRTPERDYGEIEMALRGAHQVDNAVVAVRLMERLHLPPGAIVEALARVSWPGRLDVRHLGDGRTVVLDAAHNPAGARALASYLMARPDGKAPLVFAAMRDKDLDGMLRQLLPCCEALVATRASTPRAADPAALADLARTLAPDVPVLVASSPRDALATAWGRSPRIVVAGSIFLIGDVMREIEGS